jgi:hypothetical protein
MNKRHCQKIAVRIDTLLLREIDQGIDTARMLAEPHYARDVLLVCDAMRGTEAPDLASHYRRATLAAEESAAAARKGFSASRFLSSLFGGASGFGNQPAVPPRAVASSGQRAR